jgi:hypothetical protein
MARQTAQRSAQHGMARRWQARAWGVAAMVMLSAGCPSKDQAKPTILESAAQPNIIDVPVPRGFKLNERQSRHKLVAGRRDMKHLYEGKSATLLVRNFYAQNMPTFGWEPTDEKLLQNIYVLKYRKGEDRCEIRIEPKYATFGQSTQVWATIQSEHYAPPGGMTEP